MNILTVYLIIVYAIPSQFGLLKPRVADLVVDRVAPARVKDLRDHLLAELGQM